MPDTPGRRWSIVGRCRHRYGLNNHARCDKRALLGLCVEHWLDRCRWDWRPRPDWLITVDLSNLNRPELRIDPERYPDGRIGWASFDYGSSGCDPVFSIGWERDRSRTEEVGPPPTGPGVAG